MCRVSMVDSCDPYAVFNEVQDYPEWCHSGRKSAAKNYKRSAYVSDTKWTASSQFHRPKNVCAYTYVYYTAI